jgi:hypothetical protein
METNFKSFFIVLLKSRFHACLARWSKQLTSISLVNIQQSAPPPTPRQMLSKYCIEQSQLSGELGVSHIIECYSFDALPSNVSLEHSSFPSCTWLNVSAAYGCLLRTAESDSHLVLFYLGFYINKIRK